ncbi:MAG TPA: hypothetical protein VE007_01910 [Thermoanaerobaculia bacterium]|nr:hypothetical protein [Thermoanaerobaculia bacterium]
MKRWDAWINHAAWALVSATGIFYGILKYFAHNPDPESRLGHPWQPSVLAAHLLVAPLAVFALGLVFRRHALARWKRGDREGRHTGGIVLFWSFAVVLSGYLIPVLTGDAARRWTGWIHAGTGLVVAAAYLLHPKRPPDEADETAGR